MSDSEGEIVSGDTGGIISRLTLQTSQQKPRFQSPNSVKLSQNMDDIEKLIHHLAYNELRVCPEEHGFLVTEHVFTERIAREKVTQMFFENFQTPALMFVPQEFLSCIASGRESGLIVNVGNTYASVVPIWNLNILRDKAMVIPLGGQDVTKSLQLMLDWKKLGLYGSTDIKEDIVRNIKERLAYVSPDFETELSKTITMKDYELPDGQEIEIGEELFLCTECLFDPSLVGYTDTPGLIECINSVITSLDPDLRDDIVSKEGAVILTGSSTMLLGFEDRVKVGVQKLFPEVKVIAPPERKSSAWIGGSIWASLKGTKTWWTTLEEYNEYGPAVVHSRCI